MFYVIVKDDVVILRTEDGADDTILQTVASDLGGILVQDDNAQMDDVYNSGDGSFTRPEPPPDLRYRVKISTSKVNVSPDETFTLTIEMKTQGNQFAPVTGEFYCSVTRRGDNFQGSFILFDVIDGQASTTTSITEPGQYIAASELMDGLSPDSYIHTAHGNIIVF